MDLQPALETVTGHNLKREEKSIHLIRQHTVIPLGTGGIYPRICNHSAIDVLSGQLYSPVALCSRIGPSHQFKYKHFSTVLLSNLYLCIALVFEQVGSFGHVPDVCPEGILL
jgi:hypothetical protein